MTDGPLNDTDLEHLRDEALVASQPTLAVGTVVLEQMIDEIVELRRARSDLQGVVAFFASAMKSGEPWSETCEAALTTAFPREET